MVTEMVRDWFAERDGWEPFDCHGNHGNWFRLEDDGSVTTHIGHPFPHDLKAAAAALPEGWIWMRSAPGTFWRAGCDDIPMVKVPDTFDEIHDRYELAKAAIEMMERE